MIIISILHNNAHNFRETVRQAASRFTSWPYRTQFHVKLVNGPDDPIIRHALKVFPHKSKRVLYPSFHWIRTKIQTSFSTHPVDDSSVPVFVRLQGMDGYISKDLFITPLKIFIT